MIISFDVEDLEDLELLLSITKRLGIKRVKRDYINNDKSLNIKEVSSNEHNDFDEMNGEIDFIFGIDNSNVSF